MRHILLLICAIAMFATMASAKVGSSLNMAPTSTATSKTSTFEAKKVDILSAGTTHDYNSMISPTMMDSLKLGGLFATWYAFNAAYNVYNAFVKKDFKYPWSTSTLQLMVGMCYAIPMWVSGVRQVPKLNKDDFMKLLPIAALNAFGHTAAVIAMFEKGGGSFTHVIKASEPVVSVILNLLINKVVPKPLTALSLLPITYGVAYASTLGNLDTTTMSKELTTKAAKLAMCSNVFFALRSIFRKNLTKDWKARTNLSDPANEHAVTTLLSGVMLLPFALSFDSVPNMLSTFKDIPNQGSFIGNLVACGMSFYMYNELQNKVLSSLGPVPTAVGNTLKRVVIFGALFVFTQGETFPPAKVLGCAIAIAGCLGFAICDSKKI